MHSASNQMLHGTQSACLQKVVRFHCGRRRPQPTGIMPAATGKQWNQDGLPEARSSTRRVAARPPWEVVVRPASEPDEQGLYPLHTAADRGSLREILALLAPPYLMRHGADPNMRAPGKPDGPMPLHLAAKRRAHRVAAALLRYGADPNAAALLPYNDGQTALQLAAERGCAATICVLLAAGADASQAEPLLHRTALHLAAERGHLEAVEALLEAPAAAGVDLNARSEYGWTPLMRAESCGNARVMAALAAAGADVNAAGSGGETALHLATYNSDTDCVAVLLRAGARPDMVGPKGDTALHVAADLGSVEVVNLLVAAGAALGAVNHAGKTAAEVAEARGHVGLAEALHGRDSGRPAKGPALLQGSA